MRPSFTLEQARRIVDLAAERNEIQDMIGLLNQSVSTGYGVTSISSGNSRGFVARSAGIAVAQAALAVLEETLKAANADLAKAGLAEDTSP